MPDYKALYLQMIRASEQAIRTLIQVQQDCEEAILREADQEALAHAAENADLSREA